MSESMDVEVTVMFHLRRVISEDDLQSIGKPLREAVEQIIEEEGLFGLVGGLEDQHILDVKRWQS